MEIAALARRLVPGDIHVRGRQRSIVLSDGQWSTEVASDRFAGLPEADATAALRSEIDRAVASLRAARHG